MAHRHSAPLARDWMSIGSRAPCSVQEPDSHSKLESPLGDKRPLGLGWYSISAETGAHTRGGHHPYGRPTYRSVHKGPPAEQLKDNRHLHRQRLPLGRCPDPRAMSAPTLASSSPSPILRALARLRLDGALRLAARFAGLRALCARAFGSFVRNALRRVREALYGRPRRRALLVGIQNVAELPPPAAGAADAGALYPGRPRAGHKKRPKHPKYPGHAAVKTKAQAAVGEGGLKGPHHDVEAMRRVLVEKYGYHPDDIVALVDDDSAAHLQPTRDNILAQMKLLVADARDGDRLFFHYAGHADQEVTDDPDEEDGKNELIISCDGYGIMDNVLKELLVEPLKSIKCKLTAVFDCCHSASLLDLPHSHCNDVYVPWMNKGRRRTKTMWANHRREADMFIPLQSPVPIAAPDFSAIIPHAYAAPSDGAPARRTSSTKSSGLSIDIEQCYPSPPPSVSSRAPSYAGSETAFAIKVVDASPPPELQAFGGSSGGDGDGGEDWVGLASPGKFTNSPAVVHPYCTGLCRKDPLLQLLGGAAEMQADVICISASKDGELSWEDGEGRSLTQYLVSNLMRNPRPTLRNLLTSVSHDIHGYYVSDLHGNARSYKKSVEKKGLRNDTPMASVVEMHNFQNPQLSSFLPLDMKQCFDP
ncbi:hypothetical protein HYPSUDRAFT_716158 [Hypholoma sublateritium FD-334 SS-4]|uniref:Peptidase C14 caspase domain-containing protein n=1 Tax=Hypholoma sublateritium (strain FD-334 SS-4) TaxID=945553 RepID=A0A0D2PJK8_HYPSF|nr:hypothetical protein HYPSUDRAFT_716158 [Hypholoma sublateritium FD-334 SS-4]